MRETQSLCIERQTPLTLIDSSDQGLLLPHSMAPAFFAPMSLWPRLHSELPSIDGCQCLSKPMVSGNPLQPGETNKCKKNSSLNQFLLDLYSKCQQKHCCRCQGTKKKRGKKNSNTKSWTNNMERRLASEQMPFIFLWRYQGI